MKTYQDLLAVGESETERMAFVLQVINEHKASPMYKTAADAEMKTYGTGLCSNILQLTGMETGKKRIRKEAALSM